MKFETFGELREWVENRLNEISGGELSTYEFDANQAIANVAEYIITREGFQFGSEFDIAFLTDDFLWDIATGKTTFDRKKYYKVRSIEQSGETYKISLTECAKIFWRDGCFVDGAIGTLDKRNAETIDIVVSESGQLVSGIASNELVELARQAILIFKNAIGQAEDIGYDEELVREFFASGDWQIRDGQVFTSCGCERCKCCENQRRYGEPLMAAF